MSKYYIKLTQEFAETNKGHRKGANVFGYAVTNANEYVCSVNALNEFCELFSGVDFELKELAVSDFPPSGPMPS